MRLCYALLCYYCSYAAYVIMLFLCSYALQLVGVALLPFLKGRSRSTPSFSMLKLTLLISYRDAAVISSAQHSLLSVWFQL